MLEILLFNFQRPMPARRISSSDSFSIIPTFIPFVKPFLKVFLKIFRRPNRTGFWGHPHFVRAFSIPPFRAVVKGVFESCRNFLVFHKKRPKIKAFLTVSQRKGTPQSRRVPMKTGVYSPAVYAGAESRRQARARFASCVAFAAFPPRKAPIEVLVRKQRIVSAGSFEKPG